MGSTEWRITQDSTDARIYENVKLGKNVKLELGSIIYGNCEIGDYCIIGTNSVIKENVKIGNYTIVGSMSLIEKDVVIGSANSIMPFVAIGSDTVIGNNCFIGPYFGHTNCRHIPDGYKGSHPKRIQGEIEGITIGNNVVIGANCSTTPGITIGDNCKISMNCFIRKDVPENTYIRSNTIYA